MKQRAFMSPQRAIVNAVFKNLNELKGTVTKKKKKKN